MPFSIKNSSFFDPFQSFQTLHNISNEASGLPKRDTVTLNREAGEEPAGDYGIDMSLTSELRRVDLFLEAVAKAGDHKAFFGSLAHSLSDNGDLQVAFHKFSADLSAKDLDHFLTALEEDPANLEQFMNIASRLSGEALSPFLEGAALAGGDVDEYLKSVSDVLAGEAGKSSAFQYSFLAAGVKQGNEIMGFINRVENMSEKNLKAVAEFATEELGVPGERNQDMNLFASVLGSTNQSNLLDLMKLATGIGAEDKSHVLKAASGSSGNEALGRFLEQAQRYAQSDDGAGLSDYLSVASDAEGRLETFTALADSLDLSAVSELSIVDTANFLDAAQANPDSIADLTRMGRNLSGIDRSYFLYAAASTPDNVDELLKNAGTLSGQDLSEYLLEEANEGHVTKDTTIFMTAILDDKDYDNFRQIAGQLPKNDMDTLTEMTNDLSGQRRSEFLQAGAASGGTASEFLNMFGGMSSDTRLNYLDVATRLDQGNREKFVQASVNAGEKLDDFIRLTNELMTEASESIYTNRKDVLNDFLSLAGKAGPNDLEGLIGFINQLDNHQRASFLKVADRSGLDVGDLTRLGTDALALGDRFSDIFGSTNLVAKNTSLSVKDYRDLINAAKSEDDRTWTNTRLSTFYRGHPDLEGLDLWA